MKFFWQEPDKIEDKKLLETRLSHIEQRLPFLSQHEALEQEIRGRIAKDTEHSNHYTELGALFDGLSRQMYRVGQRLDELEKQFKDKDGKSCG
jgi:hypothetical protein